MPHVLVPLDGSPLAGAAVPLALDLDPRAITLLHVVGEEDQGRASGAFHGAETHGLPPQRCAAVVRRGRPAEVIQAVAAEVGATLIAMSTHGRTGFNRLVLGSVAEEVVRASSTPVLLTRSGAPAPRTPLLGRPSSGTTPGGPSRPSPSSGGSSTVLLETAEQEGCTLLMVATHGRSGVTRWIFGSVAEERHTSPVPLLVVR